MQDGQAVGLDSAKPYRCRKDVAQLFIIYFILTTCCYPVKKYKEIYFIMILQVARKSSPSIYCCIHASSRRLALTNICLGIERREWKGYPG